MSADDLFALGVNRKLMRRRFLRRREAMFGPPTIFGVQVWRPMAAYQVYALLDDGAIGERP